MWALLYLNKSVFNMKKDNSLNIILDYKDVENKIKRISLEIIEDNIEQKKLIKPIYIS